MGFGLGFGKRRGSRRGNCLKCVQFFFCGFNVIFWLIGCALLGVGIWLQCSKPSYSSLSSNFSILGPISILIVMGVFILLISFFGCCGSLIGSRYLLTTYIVLVVIIFITEIVLISLAFRYKDEVEQGLAHEMLQGLKNKYPFERQEDVLGLREVWAYIQSNYSCCGVYNASDWDESPLRKPPTQCCLPTVPDCDTEQPQNIYSTGCMPSIKERLKNNFYVIGIILIIITVFQVHGLVAAISLAYFKG